MGISTIIDVMTKPLFYSRVENGLAMQEVLWTDWNEVTFPAGPKIISMSFFRGLMGEALHQCKTLDEYKTTYSIKGIECETLMSSLLLYADILIKFPDFNNQ